MDFKNDLQIQVPVKKLTLSKEIAIILMKFQYNHIISDIKENMECALYEFKDISQSYTKQDRMNFLHNYSAELRTKLLEERLRLKLTSKLIHFPIKEESDLESNNQKYLEHVGEKETVCCRLMLNKSFSSEQQREMNQLIKNISSFEEYRNIISKILGISLFHKTSQEKNEIHLNLNKINELLKLYDFENDCFPLPSDYALEHFIETIKFYKNMKLNALFGCGPVTVHRGRLDLIYISYSKNRIVAEKSFDKFKYIFHPGIYSIVSFLERSGNLDRFRFSCQKMIYRRI